MNRIFITGDVHGRHDWQKLLQINSPYHSKSDVLIVAGDWGFIWHNNPNPTETLCKKKLEALNYSLFIVLGNHENYDRIYSLPTKQAYGNTVWYEPEFPSIVYAQRGLIYTINGNKFWCFGGAFSVDFMFRKPHESWWEQELPTKAELNTGLENLISSEVNYIVTHTCPVRFEPREKWLKFLEQEQTDKTLEIYFDNIWDICNGRIKGWFSGHYHTDKAEPNGIYNHLYNSIIEIC